MKRGGKALQYISKSPKEEKTLTVQPRLSRNQTVEDSVRGSSAKKTT